MDKKVEIKRTVYNKDEFQKVIKRGFTTFTQPQPIVDTDTVEELFRIYEKLFFTVLFRKGRSRGLCRGSLPNQSEREGRTTKISGCR